MNRRIEIVITGMLAAATAARDCFGPGNAVFQPASLEEVERRYILRVWEAAGGNKSLAAQRLGVNRKTLYRKLKSYGVEV